MVYNIPKGNLGWRKAIFNEFQEETVSFTIEVVYTYFFIKVSSGFRVDFSSWRRSDAGIVTDEWRKIHLKDDGRLIKRTYDLTLLYNF